MTRITPARFLALIGPATKTGCWEWQGSRRNRYGAAGYGRVAIWNGEKQSEIGAHRMVWEIVNGPVPDGLFVCHHCDNPPCVRPSHLFLGTPKDNVDDAVAKGRIDFEAMQKKVPHFSGAEWRARYAGRRETRGDAWKKAHPPEGQIHGVRQHSAKLTPNKVVAIRRRYANGGVSQQAIADELGVHQSIISDLVRGKTWALVGGPIVPGRAPRGGPQSRKILTAAATCP